MKDIADDLGVSVVTVSKVLSNDRDIGARTRERVMKRIQELNYQPNPNARALATGRSQLIGLVVPDLVHQFFSLVAKGAAHVFRKQHYGLIITSSEEDPELEREEIQQMLARRLDAVIIASTQQTPEAFDKFAEQKKPYVLIDRKFQGFDANFVGVDDVRIGTMASEHLIENGSRAIAYIGGRHASTTVDRLAGYQQTLKLRGLPYWEEHVIRSDHWDDSADATGYTAMKKLLKLKRRPDGVFCANDPVAVGAMKAILEAGLRIPGDMAIIGCGNLLYGASLRVPLSSIDQNSEALGEQAARIALKLLEAKQAPAAETLLLEPRLIARESSVRARREK